jgi:ATP-dependent DNA helicase PIF1
MQFNSEFNYALDFVKYTNKSIFLTGKAGTGKTTFLRHLKDTTEKNCIVVAPTGVAAINAGGVTIHSMFNLPPMNFVPTSQVTDSYLVNEIELKRKLRYRKDKRKLFQSIQTIIIDEISMVRSDLLDAIDVALRFVRANQLPFGGVQMVFIGDMFQLPPVIQENEWMFLKEYYASPYFFSAKVFQTIDFACIELQHIYRQSDFHFIELLNAVRNQSVNQQQLEKLNATFQHNFSNFSDYITLTTHNYKAQKINELELNKLTSFSYSFTAEIDGDFKSSMYPTDEKIILKEGAQIMFIKNDSDVEKSYYNGKLAKVSSIYEDDDYGIVIEVIFNDSQEKYRLKKETWKNIEYKIDEKNGETKENTVGTFTQYPIRLAWSVTIHKSQGLTFEKAVIDASEAFATGQVYVALSRCKTLEGIILNSKIRLDSIKTDPRIIKFQQNIWSEQKLQEVLTSQKYEFAIENIINHLSLFSVSYQLEQWNQAIQKSEHIDNEFCKSIYSKLFKTIFDWNEVVVKYKKSLYSLLEQFKNEQISWNIIEEKTIKGNAYFYEILIQELIPPVLAHLQDYKRKTKIKTYLNEVYDLLDELKFKKLQLEKLQLIDLLLFIPKLEKEKHQEVENQLHQIDALEEHTKDKKQQKEKKEKRISNHLKTYFLHKEGKSSKEIAELVGFTENTIIGHLIRCYQEDLEVSISEFLDASQIEFLKPIYDGLENKTLTDFYLKCEEKFSYTDLKWYLAYENKINPKIDAKEL